MEELIIPNQDKMQRQLLQVEKLATLTKIVLILISFLQLESQSRRESMLINPISIYLLHESQITLIYEKLESGDIIQGLPLSFTNIRFLD